jgi:type I restriction enzyme S subunit
MQKAIQEKALMSQVGLIAKPKQLSPIDKDECPFSLPSSWTWVRLEDICAYVVDCLHRTPKYQNEGYPAIRTSEMQPGRILFDQARKVGREEYELQTQRLVPKAGDVFYTREGSFGIAAVVPEGIEMCLSQRMMQFRLVSELNPHFFSWVMNSSVMYRQAARDVVGMTVPHVNIRSLKEFIFPLAPYAEQNRIVAKVDELMKMCDRLEESLRQSQQQAEALAASAISHLTI